MFVDYQILILNFCWYLLFIDNSFEYTDSTGTDLHEFIVKTLKNPRYSMKKIEINSKEYLKELKIMSDFH